MFAVWIVGFSKILEETDHGNDLQSSEVAEVIDSRCKEDLSSFKTLTKCVIQLSDLFCSFLPVPTNPSFEKGGILSDVLAG